MKKFFFFCAIFLGYMAHGQTVYDTVMDRVNTQLQKAPATAELDAKVNTFLSKLNINGQWTDFPDYAGNITSEPLERIKEMAKAYTREGSRYKGSSSLKINIDSALSTWYKFNPKNTNWWYKDIGYPKDLGEILIVMRFGVEPLDPTLESNLISRMLIEKFIDDGGTNTSDEAKHYLYRACLTRNSITLEFAIKYSFIGLTYDFVEGLKIDNSFQAHNNQLYIDGYGRESVRNFYEVASYLAGTTYALDAEKLKILNKFYLETFIKAGKGVHRDFNVMGRGVTRGSGLSHSRTTGVYTNFLEAVRAVNPDMTAVLDSVEQGTYQIKHGHNRYFRADYDLHTRPGFTFGVRTVSTRSNRSERGNGENKMGKFISDGVTNIQRIGPEYENIYPIWEWDKIPGTTTRDVSGDSNAAITSEWAKAWGSTAYVGGVSDGLYGASAFDMNFYGVKAKKSWFYFDNEVVCLGAGIASAATEGLVTTVNQCWLFGNIEVSNSGITSTIDAASNTSTNFSTPNWVLHDKIGYFFPAGGNITVNNKVQTGNWNRINSGGATTNLSGTVFKMWFNHGVRPTNGKYAYIVVPNVEDAAAMQGYNVDNIKIIQNSDTVQAVKHLGLDMMHVLFYKAGTLTDGDISITVDAPCALELKHLNSANVDFYIADPAQEFSTINVRVKMPGITGGERHLAAMLPSGKMGGASVHYVLDQNLPQTPPTQFTAMADAYVRNGSYANTNYGTATRLYVKQTTVAGYARESFFKFNLRSIKTPVKHAKLRLYVASSGTQTPQLEWAIYQTNTGWGEGTINWNNKPAQQDLIAARPGQTLKEYVEWDITALVNGLHPDSLLSLKLIATLEKATGDAGFDSKESTFVPEIVVELTPPPLQILPAIADSYIRGGTYANSNYGVETSVVVKKSSDPGYAREAIFKFDTKNIQRPVNTAKLRLYVIRGNTNASLVQWAIYQTNTNWTELDVKWNKKPAKVGLIATRQGQSTSGYVDWDITTLINNLHQDSLLSLQLVSTIENSLGDARLSSKEGDSVPQIILNYEGANGATMTAQSEMLALKSRLQNTLTSMKTAEELKSTNETDIFPANLITPNGDGRNDTWLIRNIDNYKKNSVKVFSINGQLIYSKQSYDNSWNATYNGAPLTDGAYVYIIDKGDQTPLVKGVLNVISHFK